MLRHSWNGPAFDAPSPKKDNRDASLAFHLRRKAGAGDDRNPTRDDPVGAEHPDAEIGDVHGAALALAVAGLPPVELGHHAVEVGALGDAVAVAAMRRDDPVAAIERGTDADGDCLLADVAVHDAVDLAGMVVGRGAFLEAADGEHLAQHLTLLVGRQVRREAHGHGRDPPGPVKALHDGRGRECWQRHRRLSSPDNRTAVAGVNDRPDCREAGPAF